MKRSSILVAAMLIGLAAAGNAWAQTSYVITDVGDFADVNSLGVGINDKSQVIGHYRMRPRGPLYSFIWEDGNATDIASLGGNGDTMAWGINDFGQVVGESQTTSGHIHGFLWEDGVMTDLGAISGDFSRARGINNQAQVTGWTYIPDPPDPRGSIRAFLWENGTMINLGTLGGWVSYGYAINDAGQVTGYSYDSGGYVHGFLWADGVMTDIGRILGTNMDINNSAQIVGRLNNNHGFLWENGVITDLGTLGGDRSPAACINDLGQIVGRSNTPTGEYHAFLWQNGTMLDLNDLLPAGSPWDYLESANGINNKGQIVGSGYIGSAKHAYLLTPVHEPGDPAELLLTMAEQWLHTGNVEVDLYPDSKVDFKDYALLAESWAH